MLRVGNASGFYGDRYAAWREMLAGGELDVLTGDYLAELTMLILGRDRLRDPALGYARTFLRQLEDCLALAMSRGVKLVTNAGGLNPAGLAAAVRDLAGRLGLDVAVGHVEGDDLRAAYPDTLTANAYLGGYGIAECLRAGADVVVTGRVTDASLVVGPALARFGWARDDWDALAGATVAGHVLECGTQATGGNFAFFTEIDAHRPGFPIAELYDDGSCIITKHPGTGGAVTVETVTAQLLYEIAGPGYLGPDVTAYFDTITLAADGTDRVRVSDVRGGAPPPSVKVGLNRLGGYRDTMEFVLCGLDIDAKADLVRAQLSAAVGDGGLDWTLARTDRPDAGSEETASALLRVTMRDPDPKRVGRFSRAAVELALGSYPGCTLTTPPGAPSPFGVFDTAYAPQESVPHTAVLPDGRRVVVPPPPEVSDGPSGALASTREPGMDGPAARLCSASGGEAHTRADDSTSGTIEGRHSSASAASVREALQSTPDARGEQAAGPTRRAPLGRVLGARSGDKGGDANLGVWARSDPAYAWLATWLTTDRLRDLLPETAPLPIDRYALPNLRAVNFVIHGLLGPGVAGSTRFDPQAKALGEWLRSRYADIPEALL